MLASLNARADLRVSHDDVDPRGWPLIVGTGTAAGDVEDLIVDTDAGKVCFLACTRTAGGRSGLERVLIPIGYARFDAEARQVVVDAIDEAQLRRLPPFHGLPVPDDMEAALHAVFTRSGGQPK